MMKSKIKFKQTEVGIIPNDWNVKTFGLLLNGKPRHGVYKPENFFGEGTQIIKMGTHSSNDFIHSGLIEDRVKLDNNELKRFQVFEKDLLFLRTSLVMEGTGKCSYIKKLLEPAVFVSNLIAVSINEKKANPIFYYYFFKSPQGRNRVLSLCEQTAAATIRSSELSNLQVPYPEYSEQTLVANILYGLDSKIELDHNINNLLEDIGKSIFKHWFIDFEFPNENDKPYKSSGGKMIFDGRLGKKIPQGWKVGYFSKIIDINPKRELSKGKSAKKIGMADLNSWQSWIKNWNWNTYKSGSKFKNGDTLFARITPSLEHGKTAFVSILDKDEVGFGSTEFIVFSKKIITSEFYIFHLSRTEEIRNAAISAMTGTSGRQRVPEDLFDHIPIVEPPSKLMDEFDKICSSLFDKISNNAKSISLLVQIRDSLITKLMSGKIRVITGDVK
ncbi:MAG: restriction endonuclease subunit S [Nitrosopumilus sp.]|uniref:restriction endonuclease subunit S n=1 Tax=Nitrosopumilus sp. TaxID=2024843 RepID=UPI00242A5670|nr:restriction endonuclease subunit S [Nitrosopumilus sp.]MCV0366330.1 restriction endonuclease subunit S [Nitrosopumilus sp.]